MSDHLINANIFRKRIKKIDKVSSKLSAHPSRASHDLITVIGKRSQGTWIDQHDDSDIDDDSEVDVDAEDFTNSFEPADNNIIAFSAEKLNIFLLVFLNTLQSIPIGLSAVIPLLLRSQENIYMDQAKFSLSLWPVNLRLLWAPIIDFTKLPKFGRRKSWLIPIQYLIGIHLMYLSFKVNDWLYNGEKSNILPLTLSFLVLNFLAASHDMAVSGWALTMFKKNNTAYLSICSRIGHLSGYFFGYVLYLMLGSPEIFNLYLRSNPSSVGIVTLATYFYVISCIFIASTTLIAVFKKEQDYDSNVSTIQIINNQNPQNIKDSYFLLYSVLRLEPVYSLASTLLLSAVGFAVCDGVTPIKLLEAGVSKQHMAVIKLLNIIMQLVLPRVFCHHTIGKTPMHLYIIAYPCRLFINVVIACIVWYTPKYVNSNHFIIFFFYYAFVILVFCLKNIIDYIMITSTLAFFTKISDPTVHGTYMAILTTSVNFSTSWSISAAWWLVSELTYKLCTVKGISCYTPGSVQVCVQNQGKCVTTRDGYYIGMIICTALGAMWFVWAQKRISRLEGLNEIAWRRRVTVSNIFVIPD